MNYLVIPLLIVVASGVTIYRGAPTAFAWLYLPVLLLFSLVPPLAIPNVPDITSPFAVIYGILFGALIRWGGGPLPRFRLTMIDAVVVLIACSMITTAVLTEHLYTGVSVF